MIVRRPLQHGPARRRSRGFSIVEALLAMLLAGLAVVAALNCVGASARTQQLTEARSRGAVLAQDLMAEILARAYEEPVDTPSFGREAGESGSVRTSWDDVDDYNGWSASPPESRSGAAVPGAEGFQRSVSVARVRSDLVTDVGSETGIKAVTVTVATGGVPVAVSTAVRTVAWPGTPEDQPPVEPGPFGYDTPFATPVTTTRKIQIATQAVLDVDATVTSMSAFVGGVDKKCRFAIYSDAGGEPGALLVESGVLTTTVASDWNTTALPSTSLAAGTYWLAFAFEHDDQTWFHEGGGELRYRNQDAVKNGFLASWGVSDDSFAVHASIYATYVPD